MLIPIRDILSLKKNLARSIIIPLIIPPAHDSMKMCENSIPFINPCPATLNIINCMVSFGLRIIIEISTGKFAIPSLRNGRGFGMIYSIVDRKIDRAARTAIMSDLLLIAEGINFFFFSSISTAALD